MNRSRFVSVVVLILGVATLTTADFADELLKSYDELLSITRGKISASETELLQFGTELSAYALNTYNLALIEVERVHQQTVAEANQIKDLAKAEGKDITACAERPEESFNSLPKTAELELNKCINAMIGGFEDLLIKSLQRVDGFRGKVYEFRFEIATCSGAILCLSPISQKIELAKIQIPQNIAKEVEENRVWQNRMEGSINTCSVDVTVGFSRMISKEFDDLKKCAE